MATGPLASRLENELVQLLHVVRSAIRVSYHRVRARRSHRLDRRPRSLREKLFPTADDGRRLRQNREFPDETTRADRVDEFVEEPSVPTAKPRRSCDSKKN